MESADNIKVHSRKRTKYRSMITPKRLADLRQRLCGRTFSGRMKEQCWVDGVSGFPVFIDVDEQEVNLNQELANILADKPRVAEGKEWINITQLYSGGQRAHYRLLVLLDNQPRPGHYTFSIIGVEHKSRFGLRIMVDQINSSSVDEQLTDLGGQTYRFNTYWTWTSDVITSTLAILNIKSTFKFLAMVIVMSVACLVKLGVGTVWLIKELSSMSLPILEVFSNFTIGAVEASGNFIRNITPLVKIILDFVSKLFGGLFFLVGTIFKGIFLMLVMIFRGNRYPNLLYNEHNHAIIERQASIQMIEN